MTANGQVKEMPGQRTWIHYGLPDLRQLPTELRSTPPAEVEAADGLDAAVEILARCLGLGDPAIDRVGMNTPVGVVTIIRDKLAHIAEKRQDARERYAYYALDTLKDPFEVWHVEYDNGNYRLGFIGVYAGKRQMFVIIDTIDGQVLWNFMHTDAKALNKHRHGQLIYQRSPALD